MTLPQAIDCHAHIMHRDAPLIAARHSQPVRDVTVEEYLDVLDRHGVGYGLLTAPSFYGSDNSLLLDALRGHRARLRGTIIVDPDAAYTDLDHPGVVGIRLNWIRREHLPDIASPGYRRLFDALRERDLHVELFLEGERLPDVLAYLRGARVKLVLDHFGCPEPEAGVQSAGFAQVLDAVRDGWAWVKLSAPYRLRGKDPRPYVDALLAAGGPGRLMWASDWPWIGHEEQFQYRDCLDWLADWVPDAEQRAAILWDTPRRLFGFGEAQQ